MIAVFFLFSLPCQCAALLKKKQDIYTYIYTSYCLESTVNERYSQW